MGVPLWLILFLPTLQDASPQQSDPCHIYTVLNDDWRVTTNLDTSVVRCDYHLQWQGWYRMFHQGASVRMPESCVPTFRCGTKGTLWLNGPHPRLEDGIVTREVCGHWDGNCCYIKAPSIQVKACPGNYTVYKLHNPGQCDWVYCTEPRTQFQQRLKMALQRELSHAEMAQFTSQIREKLIQMGNPSDITVKMV